MIDVMERANVYRAEFEYEDSDPDGYRSGLARVGALAGGRATTVKLFELPPQQAICPYHYEYEEEWLVVLEGEVVLRSPQEEEVLERGALVCFESGPAGAHKITNRSEDLATVMMWSSSREPAVAVYPDSDKVGVWPGEDGDKLMLRRADGAVDYWDGEP
jgi:uncharacterized cupin superfamily protein